MHMVRGHPGLCLTRWWDRENRGILVDLGDQNSAVAPRAILPLCFTLHKMQLLSSAGSASTTVREGKNCPLCTPACPQGTSGTAKECTREAAAQD